MRLLLAGVVIFAACGGHPPQPKRGVVEADLGAWKFRRFQPVLDVEVMIEGNRGEGFTASYVSDAAEKTGHVDDKDVVNVFVTRYDRDDGIVRATVKLARRLAAEQGYAVDEAKIAGARTLTINGRGESWVMWPAKQHVIKIGGRGRDDVPKAMVASYVDRYPSDLPGGALEGPLPPGPDEAKPKQEEKEPYDPNNPRPDLDKYDPKKAKLPEKKK
ncbi:MAG: hypothetical protein ACM31C_07210 [Acidobacteriota bacterium]